MNDEDHVVRRLRELGEWPVPDHVRRRHRHLLALGAAADTPPTAGAAPARPSRLALVASIAAVSVVSLAVGVAVAIAGGDDSDGTPVIVTDDGTTEREPETTTQTADDTPTTVTTSPTPDQQQAPEDVPVDPFPVDPCKGPPPFAGQDPIPPGALGQEDPGAGRQAASDAWEESKRSCPADDTTPGGAPDG